MHLRAALKVLIAVSVSSPMAIAADNSCIIGRQFEDGIRTAPDYTRAAAAYESGLDRSGDWCRYSLAKLYVRGLGVEQDDTKAIHLLERDLSDGAAGDMRINDELLLSDLYIRHNINRERALQLFLHGTGNTFSKTPVKGVERVTFNVVSGSAHEVKGSREEVAEKFLPPVYQQGIGSCASNTMATLVNTAKCRSTGQACSSLPAQELVSPFAFEISELELLPGWLPKQRLSSEACMPNDLTNPFSGFAWIVGEPAVHYVQLLKQGTDCKACLENLIQTIAQRTGVTPDKAEIAKWAQKEAAMLKELESDPGYDPRYPRFHESSAGDLGTILFTNFVAPQLACNSSPVKLPVLKARTFRIKKDELVSTADYLVSINNPVGLSIDYRGPDGQEGWHATTIVGVKTMCGDYYGCAEFFKIRNSWGELWQDHMDDGWVEAKPVVSALHQGWAGQELFSITVVMEDNAFSDAVSSILEGHGIGSLDDGIQNRLQSYLLETVARSNLPAFDPKFKIDRHVGERFGLKKMMDSSWHGQVFDGFFAKSQVDYERANMSLIIAGGDAFIVHRPSDFVVQILPDIMNLNARRPSVAGFTQPAEEYVEHAQRLRKSEESPVRELKNADFVGKTPEEIPSARTVAASEVWNSVSEGMGGKREAPVVLAANPGVVGIPTAYDASFAAQGGTLSDGIQSRLARAMGALAPDKSREIIIYGRDDQTWLSYNLGLRLIKLGYTNVRWYRQGIDSWMLWAHPLAPVSTLPDVSTDVGKIR